MRTTIRMQEDLARQLKQLAVRENRSFTDLVEEAAIKLLAERRQKPQKKPKIVLPVAGDPNHKMTDEQYRAMIERMYDEEAEDIIRGR